MRNLVTLLYHDVFRTNPAESGFSDSGAGRYKLSATQFSEQLAAIAAVTSVTPVLITGASQIANQKGAFAITFDDGGISYYNIVADALEMLDWRGHCLVTSGQIGELGFLGKRHIRELHRRGHVIGTHTVSHPDRINECDWSVLLAEWRSSKACLEDVTGDEVSVGSVPGGYCSPRVIHAAAEAGLKVLFTSEPEARVRLIDNMLVIGRFALRASSPTGLAPALVRGSWPPMWRAWLDWNGKKVLKRTLGGNYRRVSNWAAERKSIRGGL